MLYQSLDTFDPVTKEKTLEGVNAFLTSNNLNGEFLKKCSALHYNSCYNPPRKPFDYYCALALCSLLHFDLTNKDASSTKVPSTVFDSASKLQNHSHLSAKREFLLGSERKLFYSNVYGITFISSGDTWELTRCAYTQAINTEIKPDDNDREKSKKLFFLKEIALISTIDYLSSLPVFDVTFELDSATKKLTVQQT